MLSIKHKILCSYTCKEIRNKPHVELHIGYYIKNSTLNSLLEGVNVCATKNYKLKLPL